MYAKTPAEAGLASLTPPITHLPPAAREPGAPAARCTRAPAGRQPPSERDRRLPEAAECLRRPACAVVTLLVRAARTEHLPGCRDAVTRGESPLRAARADADPAVIEQPAATVERDARRALAAALDAPHQRGRAPVPPEAPSQHRARFPLHSQRQPRPYLPQGPEAQAAARQLGYTACLHPMCPTHARSAGRRSGSGAWAS